MLTGIIRDIARCTAPTRGHHTASGRAACPACGGRSEGHGYGSSYPSYTPSYALPTAHRLASPAAEAAAAAGRVAAQGRAGREPVRPWHTRRMRSVPSRQSAKPSKNKCRCLMAGTTFSAMPGTTGQRWLRNCTNCSNHAVSRSSSAKETSALVHRQPTRANILHHTHSLLANILVLGITSRANHGCLLSFPRIR
jgi:hypothetical protein